MLDVIGCEFKTCAEKNSGTKLDASIDEIEGYVRFSGLIGNTRKQHPMNHCLQKTNTH